MLKDRQKSGANPNYERIVFLSTGWIGGTSHHAVLSKNGTYSNMQTGQKIEDVEPFVVNKAFAIVEGSIFKDLSKRRPVTIVPNVNGGNGASWFTYGSYRVYSDDAKDLSAVFLDIDRQLERNPGGLKDFN